MHSTVYSAKTIKMDLATFANVFCLCIVNITLSISGILLNSVVITSLWKSAQLRKKLCYFMILVLSCFDLTVVIITHPLIILSTVFMGLGDYEETRENIRDYICMLFNGFSMAALMTLNIERFLAVTYPFHHERWVTKERLISFLAFLLILAVVLTTLTFNDLIIKKTALITTFFLLFSCMFIYLNYKTLMIAKSKSIQIKVAPINEQNIKRSELSLRKMSTCSLAVLCFCVCCCPEVIHSLYNFKTSKTPLSREKEKTFCLWSVTFVCANSTFNCLILFWRNTVLRREGMRLVKYMRSSSCCRWMARYRNGSCTQTDEN